MGNPSEVVFVRHGQSEANILQKDEKEAQRLDLPQELRERPDWEHRLTPLGREQARVAGQWITENYGDIGSIFQGRYYSSFVRARETAAILGGPDLTWRKHNLLYERDWGDYGVTPRSEQATRFPRTHRMRELAPLYARLDGGEALADSPTLRMRSFRDTLKRRWIGQKVIAVVHGDTMGVARYVYEDMLPEQWHEVDRDKSQNIENCDLLIYSDRGPKPDEVLPYLGWMRMIRPTDLANSPFGGDWQKLSDNRFMSGAEILQSVEKFPHLIPEDFYETES